LSPSKAPVKPVTPESVKGLMVIEAVVLGFLSFWMVDEYMHNVYLQQYANGAILGHLTTYTIVIGVAIGLASTFAIFTLWRNLKETRNKLERVTPPPRLKAPVRHVLSSLPTMDEDTPLSPAAHPSVEMDKETKEAQAPTPENLHPPENQPKPASASAALRAEAVLHGDMED